MKSPLINILRDFFRKARAGREFIFPHTPFSSRPARPVRRSLGEGGADFREVFSQKKFVLCLVYSTKILNTSFIGVFYIKKFLIFVS
jgi:hypothetical protein